MKDGVVRFGLWTFNLRSVFRFYVNVTDVGRFCLGRWAFCVFV